MTAPRGIPLIADPGGMRERALGLIAKAIVVAGRSKIDKRPIEQVANELYSDDRHNIIALIRAPTTPTSMTPALSRTVLADFTLALTTISAGAQVFARSQQLRFGNAGQIAVPSIGGAVAQFTAEGQPISVYALASDLTVLAPRMLKSLVALSREMIEGSNAETTIIAALKQACGPAIDRALFSTTPASPAEPGGILAGAIAVPPGAGSMVEDLATLVGSVGNVAQVAEAVVVVAHPERAVKIALSTPREPPFVLLSSAAIGRDQAIALATNALVVANGDAPVIDVSKQSMLHMDTAAQPGLLPPTRSLWQTDSIAIRLSLPISWQLATPTGAVAVMDNISGW
jgi:hypothetical protein